jgi:endo-1,4-beta-xylanase
MNNRIEFLSIEINLSTIAKMKISSKYLLLFFFLVLQINASSQTNLIVNGGFEDGTTGWTSWSATLATTSDAHSGSQAALVSNRKNPWDAMVKDITPILELGKEYKLSFWLKNPGPAANLRATIKVVINGVDKYKSYCWTNAPVTGSYAQYSEIFTISETGTLTLANLYFETEAVDGVFSDYIIDDVVLVPTISDPGPVTPSINGLKDIKSTMKIGGCVTDGSLNYFTSKKAKDMVLRDCNTVTVQCYPAWGRWDESLKYVYHLDAFNTRVKELKAQNLVVTAHMLAGWDQYFPNWYKTADFDSATVDTMLHTWIDGIIKYKGDDTLVDVWNVVNESINWDGKGGYWPIKAANNNNACEFQRMGFEPDASGLPANMKVNTSHPVYIRRAFEYARAATNKKLELRETSMEFPTDQKYKSFYQLVVHLQKMGTPLDVVGFQTHLDLEKVYDWEGYIQNIKRFRALGLEVIIPEVDFGDKLKVWTEEKAELQKIAYYQLVTAAIKGGASDFQTWGFNDGNNTGWRPGESAFQYTNSFEPKPAYFGMKEALIDMSHILFWEMETSVNDTIADVMTYNNIGKLNNFGTPNFVPGFKAKALQFDGVDDFVATDALSDSIKGDFTLSLMFKTTSSKESVIAEISQGDAGGLKLGMNADGKIYLNAAGVELGADLLLKSPVNDGEWHFVALRRDSSSYQIFIDTIVSNQSGQGAIGKYNKLIVGAGYDGSLPFEGSIDEVRLYDTRIELASYVRNLSPVTPMSLALVKNKMIMKLTWLDLSNNESGFIIERKTTSGAWEEHGFVAANIKGFTDTVPDYSTEYAYRIRAYNRYGKSGYTNTKTIVSAADPTTSVLQNQTDGNQDYIFPNPAKDSFSFSSDQVSRFKILDMQGKVIMERDYLTINESVDIRQLESGIYVVGIYENKDFSMVKMVKQ